MTARELVSQTRTSALIRWCVDERERVDAARRYGVVAEMEQFSIEAMEQNQKAMLAFMNAIEDEIDRRCPS